MGLFPLNQEPKLLDSPIDTPSIGSTWILPRFSIGTSTTINATPLECLTKIVDTTTWPSWNTYVKRNTIKNGPPPSNLSLNAPELQAFLARPEHLFPGAKLNLEAWNNPDGPPMHAHERVSILERFERDGQTGYRISWMFDVTPYYVLHTERVLEFIEARGDDGSVVTEYYDLFTCGGPIAPVVRLTQQNMLFNGFGRFKDSLKKAVEADAAAARAASS